MSEDKRCPKCGHYNPDWCKECEMCGSSMKMLMTRRNFLFALGAIGTAAVTVAAGIVPPKIEVPKAEVLVPNPYMTLADFDEVTRRGDSYRTWIAQYSSDYDTLSSDVALPEGFFDDSLFRRVKG